MSSSRLGWRVLPDQIPHALPLAPDVSHALPMQRVVVDVLEPEVDRVAYVWRGVGGDAVRQLVVADHRVAGAAGDLPVLRHRQLRHTFEQRLRAVLAEVALEETVRAGPHRKI